MYYTDLVKQAHCAGQLRTAAIVEWVVLAILDSLLAPPALDVVHGEAVVAAAAELGQSGVAQGAAVAQLPAGHVGVHKVPIVIADLAERLAGSQLHEEVALVRAGAAHQAD